MGKKPLLVQGDRVRVVSALHYLHPGAYTVLEVDREGVGHYQVRLSEPVGWIDPAHLEVIRGDRKKD